MIQRIEAKEHLQKLVDFHRWLSRQYGMKVGIPADAAFDYKGGLEEAEEAQELNLMTID